MSGIYVQNDPDFAGEPRKEIHVCFRCGQQKPTQPIDGEQRCAYCDAAINSGEPIRDIWAESKE